MIIRLLPHFIRRIIHDHGGERYGRIMSYFLPEFITAFLLYSLPFWIDAYFIGSLKSTSAYATQGVTSTLVHLLIKISEGVSVGTIVLSGNFNGMGDYKNIGRTVRDAFWLNVFVGGLLAGILYIGAPLIYQLYGVSDKMIALGVPFLRMQAVSLFFMFIAASLFGFIRGIKNTKVPMAIFIAGIVVFMFFDYALIFGRFGFQAMELRGSAMAQVIRYMVMAVCALAYVFLNPHHRKYGIQLFSLFTDSSWMGRLFVLSIPIMIDKATMALAYVWLGKLMCTMGKQGAAAFSVIKDMERFSILPAVAFAQVVTLLVSNNYGAHDWESIKSNVKKILLLATGITAAIVLCLALFPEPIIRLFDQKDKFTQLAAFVYPFLGVLVFFDMLQLILAGALRATGNVRMVMLVRVGVFVGFLIPVSYIFTYAPFIEHQGIQFVCIYGSFYIANAIMSVIFIKRFRGNRWKTKII